MKKFLFALIVSSLSIFANSQSLSEYTIKLEPVTLSEFAGVQSYSWGKSGDEVLIIGGRLDGLHRRQPFASFDSAGHNNQLIVINTKSLEVWKCPVSIFKAEIANQLKATNHCFHQQNDTLILVGGYGINEETKEHVTFNSALCFKVSDMIRQVKNKSSKLRFVDIKREENELFSVTGGQLNYINGWYYLVGGHNFQGRYNPNEMATFVQKYTDGMFRFSWNSGWSNPAISDGVAISVEEDVFMMEKAVLDSLLHKRDYNMVKVKHVADTNYLVALSGVFQYDADLPFQNAVQITPEMKLREYPDFRQMYNQYECADFSVFDAISKTTTTFLIGGISNFYDSLGVLVQNDDVPFVPTMSKLLFAPDGSVLEYLLPDKLPQLLGSGAAFIPNSDPRWNDGFFEWAYSGDEEIFMGYMLGGILANQPSTFWYTEGEASSASNGFYKVYLQRTDQTPKLNPYSKHPLNVRCEKNYKGKYDILLNVPNTLKVQLPNNQKNLLGFTVTVKDKSGKIIKTKSLQLAPGEQKLKKFIPKKPGMYSIEIKADNRPLWNWTQCLVVE